MSCSNLDDVGVVKLNNFDSVIEQIGSNGYFQKRFTVLFNGIFIIVANAAYFSTMIALAVPDHWCKVPMKDGFQNLTELEWKKLTIPWQNDSWGTPIFSKCTMYNLDFINGSNFEYSNEKNITSCQFGWEYDKSWYYETIPSKENWVCDDDLYVTNSFTFSGVGDITGAVILGQFSDIYGRKKVYLLSVFVLLLGRILSIFTTHNYILFLLSLVIGSMTLYTSPLVVSMEISNVETRSLLTIIQCLSCSIGFCLIPFVFWAVGHWMTFMLIITLPLVAFMFLYGYMIESPRWLADKGRMKECITELKKIAKANKTVLTEDMILLLQKTDQEVEKTYGIMSLFSSWRMTKLTLVSIMGWVACLIMVNTLTLNLNNLGGNPFINYFLQGLVEVPGQILANYLCGSIGRRFTKLSGFIGAVFSLIALIYFSLDSSGYQLTISGLSILLKFMVSITSYAAYLHTMEIYPTCLRQTGVCFSYTVASVITLTGPYIVYLGIVYNPACPYVILFIIVLLALVTSLYLPETLHEKMPETIKEAENFGRNQKIWKLPKKVEYLTQKHTLMNNVDKKT